MTVRSRLLAGFAAIIAILLGPGLFAADRLAELQTMAVEGRARQAGTLLALGQMRGSLGDLDRYQRSYVATGEPSLREAATAELAALAGGYRTLLSSGEDGPVLLLDSWLAEVTERSSDVDRLMAAGDLMAATEAFGALEDVFGEGEILLAAVTDSINLRAQRELARAEVVSASARRDTLLGTILGLLIAMAVATWVAASLTRPLESLGRAMARVADGRFDPPDDLPVDRRDEIGELATSFRVMSHRLADLDRLKAEFLGVASHELKTPINTIHGYAEIIRDEWGDQAPDEYNRMVDGIVEQARTMARLVDRLMDLSRLETGSYRTHWEQVHVQDLVTGLLRGYEVLAKQAEIVLEHRILPDAPSTVEMDLDLMRDEVLGNLLQNAIRHTPRGGRVEIVVSGVPQGVVFTVSDSGPGVPAEDRRRIFQKYYRAGGGGGTGLGLAIAREVVLLHGGFITVAVSEGGEGASFRVVLPLRPPSRSLPATNERPPAGGGADPGPEPSAVERGHVPAEVPALADGANLERGRDVVRSRPDGA